MFLFQRSESGIMRRRYFGHSSAERRLAAHSSDLATGALRETDGPKHHRTPATQRCGLAGSMWKLHNTVEAKESPRVATRELVPVVVGVELGEEHLNVGPAGVLERVVSRKQQLVDRRGFQSVVQ